MAPGFSPGLQAPRSPQTCTPELNITETLLPRGILALLGEYLQSGLGCPIPVVHPAMLKGAPVCKEVSGAKESKLKAAFLPAALSPRANTSKAGRRWLLAAQNLPSDRFDLNSTFHRLRLKFGAWAFTAAVMNLEFKQHMARSKIARAECVPQIQSMAFHSLFFPLQRGFTSCLFSDTVLADMWSEKNQYQHSGMYFLKRFIGGSLLFQRGIIECSTHCTFDLFNMKREMGTAMILSISLTIQRLIWKLGLLVGIVWLEGWGICSASSLPKCQFQSRLCWDLAGPTEQAGMSVPGELCGCRWSHCNEVSVFK